MDTMFFGLLVRLVQVLTMSAPTILVGIFVAGVFQSLVGPDNTKRVFGGTSLRSLVLAWLLGMLLPVCSLGVIPVLRVMRRAGLSGGTLLAFALSAPLFNPLSLLYGLTLSRPLVIVAFAGCSLVIVTLLGLWWDRTFPNSEMAATPSPPTPPGWRRMLALVLAAVRETAGPSLWFIVVGICGSAALAAALPHGALQFAVNGDNLCAPLNILPAAVFCYSTPQQVMGQIGSMFTHGNSVGAALVLLALGTGLNLGTLGWMAFEYQWKRASAFIVTLVLIVMTLAYAVNSPLHPREIEPANHTHAFDVYTNPFHAGHQVSTKDFLGRLSDVCPKADRYALIALGVLVLLGVLMRSIDPSGRVESWLQIPVSTNHRYDWILPAPVVGMGVLIGLIVVSVAGCYVFYPPAETVFQELASIRAEAITNANKLDEKEAEFWLSLWDEWSRRLEVGVYLRKFRVSDFQRIKGKILRNKLELLKHEVEEGDSEAVKKMVREVHDAHNRFRQAFAPR